MTGETRGKAEHGRWEHHRPNKLEIILQSAIKVMCRNGYKDTTMGMIAKEAGVSCSLVSYYSCPTTRVLLYER